MFRLGGKLCFDQKNLYLGLFKIFSFENWQFFAFWGDLGYSSSNQFSKQSSYKKPFWYNFAWNSAFINIKTVKIYPQSFEISLFENCPFFTTCSFSHMKHCGPWDFRIQVNYITKLGNGAWFDYDFWFYDSADNSTSINTKTVKFYLELFKISLFEKK